MKVKDFFSLGIFNLTYNQTYFLAVLFGVVCGINSSLNNWILLIISKAVLGLIVLSKVLERKEQPSTLRIIGVMILVLFAVVCLKSIFLTF